MPSPPQELVLRLAPMGKGVCQICERVGPLNGALVIWWSGVPHVVVCPECMQPGRGVAAVRTVDGMRVAVQGDSPIVVQANSLPSSFVLNQERAARAPSHGWAPGPSNREAI